MRLESGLTATPLGRCPTGIVATTELVSVLIADTSQFGAGWSKFVMYTNWLSGLTSTPRGPSPAPILSIISLVDVSITFTMSSLKSPIYANG